MVVKVFEELKKVNPFMNKTQTSYYDSTLDDRPLNNDPNSKVSTSEYYRFEKGVEGHIEYMTAEEYIDKCAKDIFNISVTQCMRAVRPKDVEKYAQLMKNGEKFLLPYLSYDGGNGQEGRHRMLAAAKAFGSDTKFPVLVVKESKPTNEEIKEYVSRRYPNNQEWGYEYVSSALGLNQEDESLTERKYLEVEALELGVGDIVDFEGNGSLAKITAFNLDDEDDDLINITFTDLESGEEGLPYLAFDDQKIRYYPDYYPENKDLYESRRADIWY